MQLPAAQSSEISQEQAEAVCRKDPALDPDFLEQFAKEELSKPHDPSLDYFKPSDLSRMSADIAVANCVTILLQNPNAYDVLSKVEPDAALFAWSAFDSECDKHSAKLAMCIKLQLAAGQRLSAIAALPRVIWNTRLGWHAREMSFMRNKDAT